MIQLLKTRTKKEYHDYDQEKLKLSMKSQQVLMQNVNNYTRENGIAIDKLKQPRSY